MHRVLVPAKTEKGRVLFVLKDNIEPLLKNGTIRKFRRFNGCTGHDWRDEDQRKGCNDYHGPERRFVRAVNWAVFPLPIRQQLRSGHSVEAILGYGEKAQEIALKLNNVANTNLSVLFQGKTGTGKSVVASILHELSTRRDGPFVKVDCGAIPPTLIESELFGFQKGSFTGAFKSKPGRFQSANGGTIFLDEISNLGMDMQTRLLGFLEERVVNSIGATSPIKLDVRVISASNADLLHQTRRNQFREDLFYRLSEFQIDLPPLKERPEDIFYLATKLLWMANYELKKNVFGFSEEAIDFLSSYDWSGNIRELKNSIRRATLSTDAVIEVEHLCGGRGEGEAISSLDYCLENAFVKGCSLHEIDDLIRRVAEKKIIKRVYEESYRNKKRTCEALGIDYSTLYRKMKEYIIE
jgi:transcriptional regulator with PAS, ATPase and Fis domain